MMDMSLQNQFRQWLGRSFSSVAGMSSSTQLSNVMAFLRKTMPPGQRIGTLDDVSGCTVAAP